MKKLQGETKNGNYVLLKMKKDRRTPIKKQKGKRFESYSLAEQAKMMLEVKNPGSYYRIEYGWGV